MKKVNSVIKVLTLGVIFVSLVVGLAGCDKTIAVEKNFTSDEVSNVEIETGLNDVIIRVTSGNQLVMSVDGQKTENFYSIKDNVLTIKLGEDDGKSVISLSNKEHKPLYLDIPAGMLESLYINSVMGSVQVSDVDVPDLNIHTEMGNITISGMEGSIEAEATTGKIESSLAAASEIKEGQLGAAFTGEIGEDSGNIMTIKSDMGNIKFE